jgi:thioredoxin-related protein
MLTHKKLFIFLMLFIVLLFSACTNSPQSAQKKIEKIAQDMKAELPKMLDRDTKLVNVQAKKLELVSEYELVNYKQTETGNLTTKNKIELYLKKQVCPGIKKQLLDRGISSRYIYKDNNGRIIGDWLISPGDC